MNRDDPPEAGPVLPAAYRLHRYDRVGSTNDEVRRLAEAEEPEGALVWAQVQTAGRGRRGREWVSPPGNLYFSLLLRPRCEVSRAAQLSFVAALALGDAVASLAGPRLPIAWKWPNDVLANGRKLAGILLESGGGEGQGVGFVVLGIGVNIASSPKELAFPATSLTEQGIDEVGPATLLQAFAESFADWYRRWQEEGFAPVRAACRARASAIGKPITVRLPGRTLEGLFRDIDADGALLLESAGGIQRVAAGDVFPHRHA